MINHVEGWLQENGMKVNKSKTEICLFYKSDIKADDCLVGNSLIKVKNPISVLGLIFDSKLSWNDHI